MVALEAAAMEEPPLCTQPLHDVYALSTEEANVAAPDVDGELFSERALRENKSTESESAEEQEGEERRTKTTLSVKYQTTSSHQATVGVLYIEFGANL